MHYSPQTYCTAYDNICPVFSSNYTSSYLFYLQKEMLVTQAFFFFSFHFGNMSPSDTNMQKAFGSLDFCWEPSVSFRLMLTRFLSKQSLWAHQWAFFTAKWHCDFPYDLRQGCTPWPITAIREGGDQRLTTFYCFAFCFSVHWGLSCHS